jgi:hypothetical protein
VERGVVTIAVIFLSVISFISFSLLYYVGKSIYSPLPLERGWGVRLLQRERGWG